MTKSQIRLARKKVMSEIHKRSRLGARLREKEISRLGDLLFCSQILLNKIESGENKVFNALIFGKTMNFYCEQMKKYE